MGLDKIEKRLPEEILAYIDEEAVRSGITRQEAVSRLIRTVTAQKNDNETEHLKQEVKSLSKILAMKDDEIIYLRSELTAVHKGLSKMADSLASGNTTISDIEGLLHPIQEKVHELSGNYEALKQAYESARHVSYQQHIPLIIIGILAGLLVLYLIIVKI
ncbi:hypothetical protein [Methanospirillum hungatei]|uniref:hypothetical protein n=1 Tax=Methanospirillum hungatei TaxID=2203 RepID=UPI0026F16E1C|nr:hypothetical protein [Methanospirillum hungatei]MCA1916372.1 hypothetical protein [Methanospirillum hungatei]